MLFFSHLSGNKLFSKKVLPTAEHGYWKDTANTDNVITDVNYTTHRSVVEDMNFREIISFPFFFPREQPFILLFKMSFKNQRGVHKHSKV